MENQDLNSVSAKPLAQSNGERETVIDDVQAKRDEKEFPHQSVKPWKSKQKLLAACEINTTISRCAAQALSILNRLTPTNFGNLCGEMTALNIKDYEELQSLVMIVFDKVTLEPKFAPVYAKLIKKMCVLKVPPPPGMKKKDSTFRALLLTKCQTEFHKNLVFQNLHEKKKELEAEWAEDPDKDERMKSALRQQKVYGNIRLIGEMFNLSLLTEKIILECIWYLLRANNNTSLLSLCQLLKVVGGYLDSGKAKERMDKYFDHMTKIAPQQDLKIRFALKDVIELRQNNWVSCKDEEVPEELGGSHPKRHQGLRNDDAKRDSSIHFWDRVVMRAAFGTAEEMKCSAKRIIKEYLSKPDIKRTKLELQKLEGHKFLYEFVKISIINALDLSERNWALTGQLFLEIVQDNLIPLDKFIDGLDTVWQYIQILSQDPDLWACLAQMLTPMLMAGVLPWSQLKSDLERHLSPSLSASLIAEIFVCAADLKGEAEAIKQWQESGWSWETFMPAGCVKGFITSKNLDFLPSPTPKEINPEQVVSNLMQIIREGKSESEIQEFVESNVPRGVDETSFTQILMAVVGKTSVTVTKDRTKKEILLEFIKTAELELQALHAIQASALCMEQSQDEITDLPSHHPVTERANNKDCTETKAGSSLVEKNQGCC